MVSANNAINNTVGASITGVTNTLTITNASDTASSAARASITVGGASASDPTINFNVSGVTDFEMGIDNDASDSFKLAASTALGTTDTFIMTTAGERTMPLNPAFLGFLSAQDNNVTGDGTAYRLGQGNVLSILFDQGGNLNTNGIFTAPVTGLYNFTGFIGLRGLTASHNSADYAFGTIGTNVVGILNPGAMKSVNVMGLTFSRLIKVTAGSTARFSVAVGGGAKTVDIDAPTSFFCGWLVS